MAVVLVYFFSSVAVSLVAVALVLKLSHKKAWYDRKSTRKIHEGDIPRLGGLGFGIAFIITALAASFITGKNYIDGRFLPALFALLLILFSGVWDDFRPISVRSKLLFQIFAALCVVAAGFVFRRFIYIDIDIPSSLQLLWIPLSIIWLVGITNAINFIDGLDGLAGGLSALIVFFFGLIFFLYSESSLPFLYSVILFGTILGFLVFNAPLPKARIFMGDGGSQLLGFSIALLPLLKNNEEIAALPVLYAAALLAIPIFDTIASVWRRIRDGKKIYMPDKSHLHHKLLNLGLSVKSINAVLCSLQIILGIFTVLAVRKEGFASLYFLGAAYVIAAAFFAAVHYLNRKLNRKKHAQ